MSDLKKLLEKYIVDEVEYVYPVEIQEELNRLDKELANIDHIYKEEIISTLTRSVRDREALLQVKQQHLDARSPILAARVHLLACSVPKVIVHVTEKPTLY